MTETTQPLEFDPYSHAVHDDPFSYYQRLRDEAPVYRNDRLGFTALSRYHDVLAALHDHDTYCSRYGITLEPRSPLPMMITMDPPDHTVMRRVVSRTFTPRRIADLEPRIRQLSANYLAAWDGAASGDLIADYAAKLPMDVISSMLGVPESEQDLLRGWSDLMVHREEGNPDITDAGIESAIKLYQYFTAAVKERRTGSDADDLLTGLVAAEVDGARLTSDEVVAFCVLLVIAGNETTTKLIGNACYWLWAFPDQRQLALDDPGLLPEVVEETLRHEGSTQIMARTTTRDVVLHEVTIPEGEKVLLLLGSGNRDERFWDRPDQFDIRRDTRQHLSFGHGLHVCLGAALARLETRIALGDVLARAGAYEIDAGGLVRMHSGNVRGYANMPITFA